MAYATTTQLTAYLPAGTVVADAARLLDRASELIDEITKGNASEAWNGWPNSAGFWFPAYLNAAYRAALVKATCAQVEFWLEVGEEHDVAGLQGSLAAGKLNISQLPAQLGQRARRALSSVNLLNAAVPSI